MRCSGTCRIERKCSDMRAAVQHCSSPGKCTDRSAVVFLVQEETGLLAVLNIDQISDPVFRDLQYRICRLAVPAFVLFQSLTFPQCAFIAFIDAFDHDAV